MNNKEMIIKTFLDIHNISFKNQIKTPLFFNGTFAMLCSLTYIYYKISFFILLSFLCFAVFFIWALYFRKRFNLINAFLYEGLVHFCSAAMLCTTTIAGIIRSTFSTLPYVIVAIIGLLIAIVFLLYRHWFYKVGMYKLKKKSNPFYSLITVPLVLAVYPFLKRFIDQLNRDFIITIGTLSLGCIFFWISVITLHKYCIAVKNGVNKIIE